MALAASSASCGRNVIATPQLVEGATAITSDGPLRRETDEEGDTHIVGTLSGLQLVDGGTGQQMTYQLFVDEDEVAEDAARGGAARTGYQRADADGLLRHRARLQALLAIGSGATDGAHG